LPLVCTVYTDRVHTPESSPAHAAWRGQIRGGAPATVRGALGQPLAVRARQARDDQLPPAPARHRRFLPVGGGDVATGEFADSVADKQAALGLAIDGIAGPRTFDAVINGTASPAGASEDPFGMHLLDGPRGRGGERATPAAEPASAPTTAARLRGVPRTSVLPTASPASSSDGSDEAEPAWWTFED
jgi:hypothetical protein